jgi:hypothetical protein
MKKTAFLLFILTIVLSGCSKPPIQTNEWTGFFYPDKDNIGDDSTWVIQPGFNSLQECQEWVLFDVSKDKTNFDYECGHKCRYDQNYKMTICKETKK